MLADRLGFNSLSQIQRECLIDHIDVGRPITHGGNEDATRKALIKRKLIRLDPPGSTITPTRTVLTDLGREMVGAILGYYADVLVKAKYLDADRRESILSRILESVVSECGATISPQLRRAAYGPLPNETCLAHSGKRATQYGRK